MNGLPDHLSPTGFSTPRAWLIEQQIGKPGSPQRLYWEFKDSLGWNSGLYKSIDTLMLLREALRCDDLEFLNKVFVIGAREFVKKNHDKTETEALVYFLPKAIKFLRSQKAIPYNLKTRRRLAAEMYQLSIVFGKEPASVPKLMSQLPKDAKTRIDEEVQKIITRQNWSRIEKRADVEKAPPAPGGRPSTRSRKKAN
jgi:hypothetical protein